ncbi:MAG: hypothetical protein ACI9G6_002783, partial [Limisphaerales bacterium]
WRIVSFLGDLVYQSLHVRLPFLMQRWGYSGE